jgi:hypothetical protein
MEQMPTQCEDYGHGDWLDQVNALEARIAELVEVDRVLTIQAAETDALINSTSASLAAATPGSIEHASLQQRLTNLQDGAASLFQEQVANLEALAALRAQLDELIKNFKSDGCNSIDV